MAYPGQHEGHPLLDGVASGVVEVRGRLVEHLQLAVRALDAGRLRRLECELGLLVRRHARHDLARVRVRVRVRFWG